MSRKFAFEILKNMNKAYSFSCPLCSEKTYWNTLYGYVERTFQDHLIDHHNVMRSIQFVVVEVDRGGKPVAPQPEAFKPGDVVRMIGSTADFVFLICEGGYVETRNYNFHSCRPDSFSTDLFERTTL